MVEEYDYLFKSIVVGDGGVGKTALTLRFSKGFFTEDYKMTIGVDFHVKTIAIETAEGLIKCKLQLWDTGGQERFSSIRPMYYRGSLGTVLVFDLTNSASFEHLPQWIEEVRSNIKVDIPILLVGNKSDLIDQRAVSIGEIGNFTRDFNLYYMETSAKTGDGVGDCFYILACLMIGQGVPEQFIANATVFTPGDIPPHSETPSESTDPYLAPPVPEPIKSFEPEPEIEFEAPPVPEPTSTKATEQTSSFEPEIEYEAPPVPEPVPTFEPQPEPEISMPEPTEIEFKTPDEILLQKTEESEPEIQPSIFPESSTVESEVYKPQTIPFSPNIPVPAPPPKEFQIDKPEKSEVSSSTQIPFRVMKREELPKPQPASMTFEPTPEPIAEPTSVSPLFPTSKTQPSLSESLIDYMPQTILSKKEMKKLVKEKKKQEKEKKNLEAREKQEKLLEDMKKLKKEKKEKQIEQSIPPTPPLDTTHEASSLFQTLTQKFEGNSIDQSTPFIPFSATKKSEKEEKSKLRIIPNVADIESEPSKFTAFTSTQTVQEEKIEPKSKDLLVCEQCGAILSSDYAFCNKCGSKL